MRKGSIHHSVAELIEPVVRGEGMELVDIEYKKEGSRWYLRVYIDKEQGISVEDCQKISHRIEDIIEIEDIVSSRYILEVSSPGLDRPLKTERDFLKNKNRWIRVTTSCPIHDRKRFRGKVRDCAGQSLTLDEDGSLLEIPLEKIAKAKLEIEFC
ncbi:MAG: ribosome maturation factor RimP [Nitrospinales bacterium]